METTYKGYYISQSGEGFTIQFEDGGIFFDNVIDIERCKYLIDTYYYSCIDGSLQRRDKKGTDTSHILPWD